MKDCPSGKIRNPATGRCVSRNGPIGKKLVTPPTPKVKPVAQTPKRPKPIRNNQKTKIPKDFISGSIRVNEYALNYIKDKHKQCFIIPAKNSTMKNYNESYLLWEDYTTKYDIDIDHRFGKFSMYGNRAYNVINKKKLKPDQGILYVPNKIKDRFRSCNADSSIRFIIMPLKLLFIKQKAAHANMVIYDKNTRTAERYEPNGPSKDIHMWHLRNKLIDDSLVDFLLDNGYIDNTKDYYPPLGLCPLWTEWQTGKMGHQRIQAREGKGFRGSCATWTVWYTDYRLSHPDMDRHEAFKRSFEHLKRSSPSFTKFIKDYFTDIYEYSQK